MTDLDSWLAAIAGERCERCKGFGFAYQCNEFGESDGIKYPCKPCHGKGRTWSIPLWELCGPLSDWLEEQGDYVRARLVRPKTQGPDMHDQPSIWAEDGRCFWWLWLPDSKGDEKHLPLHELARRLRLLWRKPCDGCGGTGIADQNVWPCAECSARGHFPQTLVVGDGPVEVPESVATARGRKLSAVWEGEWIVDRVKELKTSDLPTGGFLAAREWAANHLLRIPPEVLQ